MTELSTEQYERFREANGIIAKSQAWLVVVDDLDPKTYEAFRASSNGGLDQMWEQMDRLDRAAILYRDEKITRNDLISETVNYHILVLELLADFKKETPLWQWKRKAKTL